MEKIAIGCDEAAYRLKVEIMKYLDDKGIVDCAGHCSNSAVYC